MNLIKRLWLFALMVSLVGMPGAISAAEQPLEQAEIKEAVTSLISVIEQDYLHDDKREEIVERLTLALNGGEFAGSHSFGRLKIKLESMLYKVSKDASFAIHWRADITNSKPLSDNILPGALQTQVLENNIGYLAVDGDLFEDSWQQEIDGALAFLAGTKALIIDLRSAGLSSLELSQHFLSFFVAQDQPLANVTYAHDQAIPLSSSAIATPFAEKIPVFIVTSPFVAGSWEFVAYTLQQADRAIVVGMPTIGLATLTTTKQLSEHLSVVMAFAAVRQHETNQNWQDHGVEPDIESDAALAMETTLGLVKQAITGN